MVRSWSLNLKITCFSLTVVIECLVDVEVHVVRCLLCKWLVRVTDHTSLLSNAVQSAKKEQIANERLKKIRLSLVRFMHFAALQTLRILGNSESPIWFVDRGRLNGVRRCGLLRVWLAEVYCGKHLEFYHANVQLQYHNWKSSTVTSWKISDGYHLVRDKPCWCGAFA